MSNPWDRKFGTATTRNRLRAIARRIAFDVETKTVGHHSCEHTEAWIVQPVNRYAIMAKIVWEFEKELPKLAKRMANSCS